MTESQVKITYSAFISKLVGEDGAVAEMHFLSGYPGPSSEESHFRLYLTPNLSSYYELPNDAVLHVEKAPKSVSHLEIHSFWLKGDTPLQMRGGQGSKAAWLTGDISDVRFANPVGSQGAAQPTPSAGCQVGPTGVQGCTSSPQTCGNTAWQGCQVGPTGVQGCTSSPQICGNTAWPGCQVGPTGVQGCTSSPQTCGNTAWQGCQVGPTGVQGCTSSPQTCGNTAWQSCAAIGFTGLFDCNMAPQAGAGGQGGLSVFYCPTAWGCTAHPATCGYTGWPGCR